MSIDYAYNMKRTSGPAAEPMTTAEAKSFARQDDDTDDTLIDTFIESAREWCEQYTRRAFITQTWTQIIDWGFPRAIILPHPPLISVTSITYIDTSGTSQTLAATEYTVDIQRAPGRAYEAWTKTFPTTRYIRQAVTVTYTAGYGAASTAIPAPIITACQQLLLHMYDTREPIVLGTISKELEMALKTLLAPYVVRS